jgi:hypothetical protein
VLAGGDFPRLRSQVQNLNVAADVRRRTGNPPPYVGGYLVPQGF